MTADFIRLLLFIFFVIVFLVSVSYLRQRKMSCRAYAFWGTFALLLPAFGPFFVIAYRPGKPAYRRPRNLRFNLMRSRHSRR